MKRIIMTCDKFWTALSHGGVTEQGDKYSIPEQGKLHILSPGNNNRRYYIRKVTVERYFTQDIPEMTEQEFRLKRSPYFYNVYSHIVAGG